MDERRRQEIIELKRLLSLDEESSQDEGDLKCPCPLTDDCIASKENCLSLDPQRGSYECSVCADHGTFKKLIEQLRYRPETEVQEADFEETKSSVTEYSDHPLTATVITPSAKPRVHTLTEPYTPPPIPVKPKRFTAERIIITCLALVFLGAGLAAATLSGFANYQAFSTSVADPLQGKIWGWTGVIAAVISFGGFTFFYWHTANRRVKEGVRALLFALAGAGTSIVGTEAYISANTANAEAAIEQAGSNTELLRQQVADWRVQLAGIPADTRSVEGLEDYIAEVERVGRTDHKPYRDARNELGLAKRRDDLQAKIDAANAELLGNGTGNVLTRAQERAAIPSWFFAGMLEIFSSQGTSIGLVALLILYTKRREAEEAT